MTQHRVVLFFHCHICRCCLYCPFNHTQRTTLGFLVRRKRMTLFSMYWEVLGKTRCAIVLSWADLIKIFHCWVKLTFCVRLLWKRCLWNPISPNSFWQYMCHSINHNLLAPSSYMLKYKWGATWQHIHMEDKSDRDDDIYRRRLLPTWQYVNFPKSLNREGIIYPSVLSKHSSVLIRGDVEKQSETCHSVLKVINNVGLLCFV